MDTNLEAVKALVEQMAEFIADTCSIQYSYTKDWSSCDESGKEYWRRLARRYLFSQPDLCLKINDNMTINRMGVKYHQVIPLAPYLQILKEEK